MGHKWHEGVHAESSGFEGQMRGEGSAAHVVFGWLELGQMK